LLLLYIERDRGTGLAGYTSPIGNCSLTCGVPSPLHGMVSATAALLRHGWDNVTWELEGRDAYTSKTLNK
jgi:hypothetical protein